MVVAKDTLDGVAGAVHAEQDCLHVVLPRFSFVFARVHQNYTPVDSLPNHC